MSHSSSNRRRAVVAGVAASMVAAGAGAVVTSTTAGAAEPVNGCHSKDNGDPRLKGLTRTPASVDVRTGAKTVKFTAKVSDTGGPGAASGVGSVWLYASSDTSSTTNPGRTGFVQLKRNSTGAWVGNLSVPRWTADGQWNVDYLYVGDKVGNYRYYVQTDLASLGYANAFTVTSKPDYTKPAMASFAFSPSKVDTRSSARKVTFTAKLNDTQSKVSSAYVFAQEPGTSHSGWAFLKKVKGTTNTFRGAMTVPRWQTNGTWQVTSVSIYDNIGNWREYTNSDLKAKGFKRSFGVVSGSDTAKPTLASFARTPATLDVRQKNKTVSITVRAKDKAAGVSFVSANFTSANAGFSATTYLKRVSGTAKNGVWKGKATVYKCFSEKGVWKADVWVYDAAGNSREYTAGALSTKGWPSKITVNARDNVAPTVTAPDTVAPTDDITLSFSESVNGISTESAPMNRYAYPTLGAQVDGQWTCQNGAGDPTNCLTGQVRKATFAPDAPLDDFQQYVIQVNPEGSLGLTNQAGNPADPRQQLFVFSSS